MASGLFALLDDVAAITKMAAASLDDVAAAAGKAGAKAAGVVIDDTAVAPRYLTGFTPDRELPIIWRITKGSVKNKLIFILPAALLLSAFLPFAITPILMIGGAYLCYEGVEKLVEALHDHGGGIDEAPDDAPSTLSGAEHEAEMTAGAIRTDLILSAEIMAIALKEVADKSIGLQAGILALVALAITFGVYGVVALIVKMDDIGLHMAQNRKTTAARAVGRGLVSGMPAVLSALAAIGTAAMIWVGGGIILHGIEEFGFKALPELVHHMAGSASQAVPAIGGLAGWMVSAIGAGIFGTLVGILLIGVHHLVSNLRK